MSATAAGCGYSVGRKFGKEYYKMIVNAGYRGKVGAAAPKFTYTGQSNIRKDGVVELLTSGTLVFLEPKVIDVFMVGGGGAGGAQTYNIPTGNAGGGGGYTRTIRKVSVNANTQITVTVGAGGGHSGSFGLSGSSSAFNAFTVNGGSNGSNARENIGGAGGSGGGGGVTSNSDYGSGGSDGNNGETGYPTTVAGGTGQGFTTREFGEATGKLYAGGGGAGRYMSAASPVISLGGAGGGGSGAWFGAGTTYQAAAAGVANTGGGGGGGAANSSIEGRYTIGASGGSGIVCFREAQKLPVLAGTWVLNERLYKADNTITQSLNFRLSSTGSADFNSILIDNDAVRVRAVGQSGYSVLYTFSTNSWGGNVPPISMTITSETASDEFRAWLASNATKQ